ncbi:hypothetical protein LOK49_LG08G01373 [Camellia lanceoleosa]|uniref:Uncharacterized protein n=1 Tax=Camellia lanceoleosa TaxID=1840588 RepID=A0ACC0GSI9_9ERIC|nr:hypothetical protein LOK49_LG08G01373 [Camellia lanceoleosa]
MGNVKTNSGHDVVRRCLLGTYLHHKESTLPRLSRLLHRALSMRLQALLYVWWGLMMIWWISRSSLRRFEVSAEQDW